MFIVKDDPIFVRPNKNRHDQRTGSLGTATVLSTYAVNPGIGKCGTGGNHFYDKNVASACRQLCIMPHALMKYLILYRHAQIRDPKETLVLWSNNL